MPALDPTHAARFLVERSWGTLVTIKSSDGRPQLSNVGYAVLDGVVRISVTDDRAKTANLRRDPRVSLHVSSDDFWTYVVAEGDADLSDVATDPDGEVATALLELYEAIRGDSHPDPDEFRTAMVDDRRLQISFRPTRLYPTR